jgi:hypothetical protein
MKAQHIPRYCTVGSCRNEISQYDKKGKQLSEGRYKLRTTCSSDCIGHLKRLKNVKYVPPSAIDRFNFGMMQMNSN